MPGSRTAEDSSGVYRAEVEVNGVRKKTPSTFFPKSWSPQQIVDTINAAYDRRTPLQNGLYSATANGITIQMRLDPSGKIVTAYPRMMEG